MSDLTITVSLPWWKVRCVKAAAQLMIACAWFLEQSLRLLGLTGHLNVEMTFQAYQGGVDSTEGGAALVSPGAFHNAGERGPKCR